MIAKKVEQALPESTKYYNLVEEVDAEKIDGTIVKISKVIEKTCLEDLTRQKENLETQIVKIDEKISAIKEIIPLVEVIEVSK